MRRWPRPQAPQTNWFAIATAIAAITVVFCGSGLGGSSPVGGQTEPLTLVLSAPQTCETTPAEQAHDGVLDEHGELVAVPFGWQNLGTVRVAWTVSGGVAPYRLTIDGQTRDGETAEFFTAQRGEGVVGCARTSGEWFFRPDPDEEEAGGTDGGSWFTPYHREQPDHDSGAKRIRAMVTDATGATAEASVDLYVVLELGSGGDRLEAGKTYRVFNGLVTVPQGIDLEILGGIDADGGETLYILGVVDSSAHIMLTERTPHREVFRHVPSEGSGGGLDLHAKYDELVASVGRLPVVKATAP